MKKIKFFANYTKEEAWLNKMASQGWHLIKYNDITHEFAPGEPSTVNYRIDYRTFKNREAYEEYLMLFADSGWRHVSGTRSSGAQYFVTASEDTGADIFSDNASRLGRTKRMLQNWVTVMLPIWVVLFLTNNHSADFSTMFNPKELYYTPGLWERTGFDFWFGFLFETPFALMRGYAWAIPVIMLAGAGVLYLRLLYLSKQQNHTWQ